MFASDETYSKWWHLTCPYFMTWDFFLFLMQTHRNMCYILCCIYAMSWKTYSLHLYFFNAFSKNLNIFVLFLSTNLLFSQESVLRKIRFLSLKSLFLKTKLKYNVIELGEKFLLSTYILKEIIFHDLSKVLLIKK